MPPLEVAPLPKKPLPPPKHLRAQRFSPRRFAEEWDKARKDPSFSVANLMLAAGVRSERTLQNWKRGIGKPDADQAIALAAVLGLPPLGLYES